MSSVPGDSVATGQRKLDDVPDIAVSLWSDTFQVLVLGLHQPRLDFWFLPGCCSPKAKVPILKGTCPQTLCGCVPPACPRQCLWPLLSRRKGTATSTRALPYLYFNHISRVYQSHLKTKPSIYISKWSPTWEPVRRTWGSPPVQVTGYEVIIILYKLMFAKAGNTLQRLEILCKRWPLEALGRSSNQSSLV